MVQATDELTLAFVLRERLKSTQDSLMEAIRQRDKARIECQRLMLALRDCSECRDQTQAALIERLRDTLFPEPLNFRDKLHVAIDITDWPNNWHLARLFDVMTENPDGEPIQVQFWLKEVKDDQAVYEAFRLS